MAEEKKEIEIKKIGFFKKMVYSITKFEKYPEMAVEGISSAFKYLAIVMLIFSIIIAAGFILELHDTAKRGIDYFQNELPNISYTDGKLDISSNDAIIVDTGEAFIDKIILDTKVENEEKVNEYINSISTEKTGILVLKDKIIIKAPGAENETTYTYPELLSSILGQEISSITKQDILNYITGSGMISLYVMFFIIMAIYVFIVYTISVLLDTLLISVLGHITTIFARMKLKFSAIYTMSVYSLTLSIFLNAIYITINSITGFEMPYFQVMYTSIAYVCLVAALFMIKSDLIKKQAELMKIMEEQEKVRQEMNKQEEKENEEKKKENKKPEEEPEEKKEENGEKGENSEPTGSEA